MVAARGTPIAGASGPRRMPSGEALSLRQITDRYTSASMMALSVGLGRIACVVFGISGW